MLKRICAAMGQRDKKRQLSGVIKFDDSYFGGPTARQKRGHSTEKAKVFVAVSLSESGNPLYLKVMMAPNIKRASVKKFILSAFTERNTVRSDGCRSCIPVLEGYTHENILTIPTPAYSTGCMLSSVTPKPSSWKLIAVSPKEFFNPIWTSTVSASAATFSAPLFWSAGPWLSAISFGWAKRITLFII